MGKLNTENISLMTTRQGSIITGRTTTTVGMSSVERNDGYNTVDINCREEGVGITIRETASMINWINMMMISDVVTTLPNSDIFSPRWIFTFNGHLHIDEFLEWMLELERFFDIMEILDCCKVKLVAP